MQNTETTFLKEKFIWDGMFLTYGDPSHVFANDTLIVARFKYRGTPITKAKFQKELIASKISPLEYKAKRDSGMTPHAILDENNPGWSKRVCDAWFAKQNAKQTARLSSVFELV